ncbi:MAG TPA: glycosyltransferase family 4 protein, partial [Terriglobia bacterium]|nr:glycosyltransferase family 4 protein [Terriglobia bacterium]
QLLRLARGLRDLDHQQLIVCPDGSELEARAQAEGFRIFTLPDHDPGHAHGAMLLRQQLRSDPVDVLHAHDGQGHSLAWLASIGLPIKRVASRRVIFQPGMPLLHRLKYQYTCHAIIAVSGYIRELLVESGIPPKRIEVIPDGVEFPVSPPSVQMRAAARYAWGFTEREFVVGHLGAFTHEKGQEVAAEALRLLASALPEVRLVLAGGGRAPDSLRSISALRDQKERILFLNRIEEVEHFFAGLDLFIMPSRAEGLGSAVLLAMANGLPVIASRAGGLPEIVEEGQTGWLVPAGSPQALADAIVRAASDRDRLVQFGRRGREKAREFSTGIMVRRTEAVYRRLLKR